MYMEFLIECLKMLERRTSMETTMKLCDNRMRKDYNKFNRQ